MIDKLMERIRKEELDPSSFFLLYEMVKDTLHFFYSEDDMIKLQEKKFIKITDYDKYNGEVRQKGIDLIKELEGAKKVKEKKEEDSDIKEWIDEYRELFRGLKPGSMGDKGGCMNKMKKFYNEYPEFANKETILNATRKYVQVEGNNNNYKFLQKAHYFIYKQVGGKDSEVSNLASFCEEVGEEEFEGFTKRL